MFLPRERQSELHADLPDQLSAGMQLLRAGDCVPAKAEFRAVYIRAEAAGDDRLMAAALDEMAWCSFRLGQPEQGLEFAIGAKLLWRRLDDPAELARAVAINAILMLDLGFSDDAFELAVEAAALAEAAGDASIHAFALNAKGVVLAVCREAGLGIELIEQAVTIATEQGNTTAAAYYLLNLGFSHAKIAEEAVELGEGERAGEERAAAIALTEAAIERAEACGDNWTLRAGLGNAAELLGLQGHHEAAFSHLDRLASLPGDPGPSLRSHYLYTLGDVLLRSGQLEPARQAVTESLALAEASRQIDHQVNAAHKLATILEASGDTGAALACYKRFHALHVQQAGETTRRRARIEEIRSETEEWRSRAAVLADQALRDPLTGIANRRSLDQILARLAGTPLAIAMLDLDNFKSINDRYSHIVGDAVLQRVAETLVGQIGPHGHTARLGGEEFALVFPQAPIATAMAFCEGVRVAIRAIDWTDLAPGLTVSASIGLAAGDGDTPSGALMQAADNRLYCAKAHGRDRVVATDAAASASLLATGEAPRRHS